MHVRRTGQPHLEEWCVPRLLWSVPRARTRRAGSGRIGGPCYGIRGLSGSRSRTDTVLLCPSTASHLLAPDNACVLYSRSARLCSRCSCVRTAFGPPGRGRGRTTSSRTRCVVADPAVCPPSPTGFLNKGTILLCEVQGNPQKKFFFNFEKKNTDLKIKLIFFN